MPLVTYNWRCFSTDDIDTEPQPEKRLKFSAFARKQRDYSINKDEEMKKRDTFVDKPLEIKPEYARIPFDPNVRHQIDDIDNKIIYEGVTLKPYGQLNEPQSMYVAV